MKKIVSLILILSLMLVACGSNTVKEEKESTEPSTVAEKKSETKVVQETEKKTVEQTKEKDVSEYSELEKVAVLNDFLNSYKNPIHSDLDIESLGLKVDTIENTYNNFSRDDLFYDSVVNNINYAPDFVVEMDFINGERDGISIRPNNRYRKSIDAFTPILKWMDKSGNSYEKVLEVIESLNIDERDQFEFEEGDIALRVGDYSGGYARGFFIKNDTLKRFEGKRLDEIDVEEKVKKIVEEDDIVTDVNRKYVLSLLNEKNKSIINPTDSDLTLVEYSIHFIQDNTPSESLWREGTDIIFEYISEDKQMFGAEQSWTGDLEFMKRNKIYYTTDVSPDIEVDDDYAKKVLADLKKQYVNFYGDKGFVFGEIDSNGSSWMIEVSTKDGKSMGHIGYSDITDKMRDSFLKEEDGKTFKKFYVKMALEAALN